MWFIGVEVEQETSASPPKKILDPPLKEVVLFSAEASLCSREPEEKEKESARGTMGRGKTAPAFSLFPSSPVRFLFFDYCYFYWDTQREPLRGRE